MTVLVKRLSRPRLLGCTLAILAAALAAGLFGLGLAPLLILGGALCALMMGSMIWMLAQMGKHTIQRH
jgi:hypothetical protein